MFNRIIKWRQIFENEQEMLDFFGAKSTKLFKNAFGEIMLARDGDHFYAFENKCPHQHKSLEGCSIHKGDIICPWHKFAFSCETGRGHGMYLEKYPIKMEENGVFLGKEGWSLFG
jgi:nitrite reductase/ring-hydroxylating ferredoxin subunit